MPNTRFANCHCGLLWETFMNYRIFLFLFHLVTANQPANGQNCSIEAREKLKNPDYTLKVADSVTFLKIPLGKTVETVTLKSENFFITNYPNLFKPDNSCYTFNGLNDNYWRTNNWNKINTRVVKQSGPKMRWAQKAPVHFS